jgi:hypothetical protein
MMQRAVLAVIVFSNGIHAFRQHTIILSGLVPVFVDPPDREVDLESLFYRIGKQVRVECIKG